MNEKLTGDAQTPEEVLEARRQIIAEQAAGLLTESDAVAKLEGLQTANPTVSAAYERNIREQGDID